MAQATIVSYLVYSTGFLLGLLTPALISGFSLSKVDYDSGSSWLKTSSGFLAHTPTTMRNCAGLISYYSSHEVSPLTPAISPCQAMSVPSHPFPLLFSLLRILVP